MSNKNIPEFLIKNYIKIKTPEERKKFIKTFEFLEFICSNFKISLDKEFVSNFMEDDNFLDLQIINKKIFDIAQEKLKNKAEDVKTFKLDDKIVKTLKDISNTKTASLEQEKSYLFQDLKNNEAVSADISKKILLINEQIKYGDQFFINLMSDLIDKMIDFNKFSKINFNTHYKSINFIVRDDILIPWNNEFVNIGKYMICLNIENLNVKVLPYENNINSHEFIHFHIFSNGGVCFGNALASYNQYVADKKPVNIITTIMHILQNFNPASPTIPFDNLINVSGGKFDLSSYYRYSPGVNYLQDKYYEEYAKLINSGQKVNPYIVPIWESTAAIEPKIGSDQIDLAVSSLGIHKEVEKEVVPPKVIKNFKKQAISYI